MSDLLSQGDRRGPVRVSRTLNIAEDEDGVPDILGAIKQCSYLASWSTAMRWKLARRLFLEDLTVLIQAKESIRAAFTKEQ